MAMVMDFFIGILLLLSAAINVLALGAFFVTPSLRSTSNRFVINLLIVNVIGCLILAPSLLFNSNIIRNLYSEVLVTTPPPPSPPPPVNGPSAGFPLIDDTHSASFPSPSTGEHRRRNSHGSSSEVMVSSSSVVGSDQRCAAEVKGREINSTLYKIDNQLHFTDANNNTRLSGNDATTTGDEEEGLSPPPPPLESNDTSFHRIRPWILDVIAAIGALSLLLVVSDTYCAVMDPLRYHSRISASRVCCLIVLIWCIAAAFGVSSALRSGCIEDILKQNSTYNTVFGSAYFLCIILIPFSLVGAMYWAIIREARKNGLRLRHNGSSPLLQSVLHIEPPAHHPGHCPSLVEELPASQQHLATPPTTASAVATTAASIGEKTATTTTTVTRDQDHERSTWLSVEANLRRNKSAQHLMGPSCCECCEQILITRSISNQSAYLNAARYSSRAPNRDLLRAARSSPDLHQNLLLAEQGVPFEHIRIPTSRPATKSLGYMTSIRHRLSNASSLFKYREESRAARISILVVIMFLVSYIPFGLLVLAEGHDLFLSTYQQTVLAIFFVLLANIISPLIFAYRNKRVRRGIQRLVSVRGRTGGGRKDRGKGDNNHHNGSLREPSERCPQNGGTHSSQKESPNLSFSLLNGGGGGGEPRRKLVIFNGKNGQITRICNPEHHKNFVRMKGCEVLKGCTTIHSSSSSQTGAVPSKNLCAEVGRNKTPPEIGCSKPTHCPKLPKANQRDKVQAVSSVKCVSSGDTRTRTGDEGVVGVAQPFLRRIRNTSGQLFKKSNVQAMRPSAPQVSIDFTVSKAVMDV